MEGFRPIKALPFFLFTALLFGSCEKVDDPYQNKGTNASQSASCEGLSLSEEHPLTRNILIEDFTGHQCGYCPGAAVEAEDIKEQYGKDRVFIAAVHCSYYADTKQQGSKFTTNFKTEAGKTYNSHWNIGQKGLPRGMIDREVWNGNRILGKSEWSNAVDSLIGDSVDVTLQLASSYNANDDEVCVKVATRFLKPMVDTLATTVYLLEDSIIDWQKNYDPGGDPSYPKGDVEDYQHDHVLRAAINGAWGETVLEGAASAADESVLSYSYPLEEGWDPDQLSVIAYVYDKESERILQVIERKVP